jgi:hypothetical protein
VPASRGFSRPRRRTPSVGKRSWSRLTTCLAIPASTVLLAATTGGGGTVARLLGQPGAVDALFASPASPGGAKALEPPVEIPASALDEANGARQFSLSSVLLSAYQTAVDKAPSSCHISVPLLAAIGQVESGSLVGRELDADHRLTEPVLGPVLNGNGFAAVADSDHGALDGDTTWDRAMGPMQFIPSTWRSYGVDADGDGAKDPQDVDDATASAAAYLCADGRDLSTEEGVRAAVLSYNNSQAYYFLVLRWKAAFENASSLVVEEPQAGSSSVAAGAVLASPTPASLGFGSDSPASVAAKPRKPAASPTAGSPTAAAVAGQSPTTAGTPSGGATGSPLGSPSGTPSGSPTGSPSGSPAGTPGATPASPGTPGTPGTTPSSPGKPGKPGTTPDKPGTTPGTPAGTPTPDDPSETPDETDCVTADDEPGTEGSDTEAPDTDSVSSSDDAASEVTEGEESTDETSEDPCADPGTDADDANDAADGSPAGE